MNNRIRILALAALLLGLAVVIYVTHGPRSKGTASQQGSGEAANQTREEPSAAPDAGVSAAPTAVAASGAIVDPSLAAQLGISTQKLAEASAQVQEYVRSLNQPINFEGKVADQDAQPLSQASVNLSWAPFLQAVSFETNLVTDSAGSFGLHGVEGYNLTVRVAKDGYYSGRESWGTFRFGKGTPSQPAPASEGITHTFRLYKKGPGTELTSATIRIRVPINGQPVKVDLFSRKVGSEGQVELSNVKPPAAQWKSATEWSFKMVIADGGFSEQTDEFPFEAPESGYRPVVEFHFVKGATSWAVALAKRYYIAFGQPRRYGRLAIDTSIDTGVYFEYVINPDGSRYLEPK